MTPWLDHASAIGFAGDAGGDLEHPGQRGRPWFAARPRSASHTSVPLSRVGTIDGCNSGRSSRSPGPTPATRTVLGSRPGGPASGPCPPSLRWSERERSDVMHEMRAGYPGKQRPIVVMTGHRVRRDPKGHRWPVR